MNEYDLTVFLEETPGLYRKYEEIHLQKAYELATVKELLEKAGMEFVAVYDAGTKNPPEEESGRICVVARERGKIKKS